MHTGLLTLVLFGWSCNGDKDDSAGSGGDADTDTDTDSDTDSDTDFFFDAKGTLDGQPFELACPPDFMNGVRQDKGGMSVVIALCNALDGAGFSVILTVVNPQVDDVTDCSSSASIQVVKIDGPFYDCLAGGVSNFDLSLTEVNESASATVWGGTFSLTGDDGTHAAEVSGSFRTESALSD